MPESSKISTFKAGIFIIISIVLIIFSILWLRYFSVTPKMTLIGEFTNPGPVSEGMQVYYKGVNIGKISKVELSRKHQFTYVFMQIYKADLHIPGNSIAQMSMEGLTGQKFIDIQPHGMPYNKYLKDGDIIQGRALLGIAAVQEYIDDLVTSGRLDKMVKNAEGILKNSEELTGNINSIVKDNQSNIRTTIAEATKTMQSIETISGQISSIMNETRLLDDVRNATANVNGITKNLNTFLSDNEFQKNIKCTFGSINKFADKADKLFSKAEGLFGGDSSLLGEDSKTALSSLGSLISNADKLLNTWNVVTDDVYKDVKKSNLINNMSCAFAQAGITFDEANNLLAQIDEAGIDGNVKQLILSTLYNTNEAAKSVDCLSDGVSTMLSRRFLLLRLLLGKPGQELQYCNGTNQKGPCIRTKSP